MKDNRNLLLILLVLTLLLSLLTIFVVAEGGVPTVSARSSVLYEPVSNTFIYEKNSTERLSMASTTKIMTALLAIERCDLNQTVKIPKEATGIEGSSLYLKEGDEITVRDLVYSVLLQSANDAATAIAIYTSGDVKSFSDLMNQRAKEIGLTDTSFENPHGLDSDNHYTTARDLAILASVALKNDTFRDICATYKHSFFISDTQRTVVNHNKLLRLYKGANGVKTGYTDKSGRCLVSSATKDGLTLIAVTLNAPNDWNDHKLLLNLGFDGYEAISLSSLFPMEFTVGVTGGRESLVKASVNAECSIVTRKKSNNPLTAKIELDSSLPAPIKKGDTVGSVLLYEGEKLMQSYEIVADATVKEQKQSISLLDFIKEHF